MINGFPTKESGFTIQELLVTLVVGSILAGFSMTTFLFVVKLYHSWENRFGVRQQVRTILQDASLDMMRSKKMDYDGSADSMMTMTGANGRLVTYIVKGHIVYRGNASVTAMSDGNTEEKLFCRQQTDAASYRLEATVSRGSIQYSESRHILIPKCGRMIFQRTRKD